jgi:transcriptional regulator with XRE-family HTH domain
MKDLRNNLINDFKDKEYRHGYVDEFLNASIATQIKVLREQRGWNQKELAKRTQMKQPRISVMENVNYASWNIKTLRRLAESFDLALRVSFEGFGDRLNDILRFGRDNLERDSFSEDPVFSTDDSEATLSGNMAVSESIKALGDSNKYPGVIENFQNVTESCAIKRIDENSDNKDTGDKLNEANVNKSSAGRMADTAA